MHGHLWPEVSSGLTSAINVRWCRWLVGNVTWVSNLDNKVLKLSTESGGMKVSWTNWVSLLWARWKHSTPHWFISCVEARLCFIHMNVLVRIRGIVIPIDIQSLPIGMELCFHDFIYEGMSLGIVFYDVRSVCDRKTDKSEFGLYSFSLGFVCARFSKEKVAFVVYARLCA